MDFKTKLQSIILTNFMKKQLIGFDPQIIQFISDREQLIKVTNLTSQNIDNCFFCMFNTERYKFVPDYFSLAPHEEKLVKVCFMGKLAPRQIKQFAYMKSSSNFSKRITLINGPATVSEDRFRSPESGVEELGTLSSRQYRDSQIQGYQKIIADKEAYIQRLQKINEQLKDCSNKKPVSQFSESKTKNFYLNQIEDLELKINLINTQKQELIRENILLQKKFEEYQQMMANDHKYEQINDLLVQKDELIKWEKEQRIFHENQCEKLMYKISELETHLGDQERNHKKQSSQNLQKKDVNIRKLQQQISKMKEANNKATKIYEQRIMQLEQQLVEGTTQRKRLHQIESQLEKKKKQIQKITYELQNQQQKRSVIQKIKEQKQQVSKNLQLENIGLTSRVQNLQKSIEQLKSQNIFYRSKIQDHDSESNKMNKYMQVALQSCKNQNHILKTSKVQLQKELEQKIKNQKSTENKMESVQRKFQNILSEFQELKNQKQELLRRNRQIKQENHQTIMKLKSQNIDLIEKVNVLNREKDNAIKIAEFQNQLKMKNQRILQLESELQLNKKQNEKLMKRIQKTRKQTKKQIKSIQDDALSELKRVKYQKNALTKKVAELQESINSQTYDLSRAKTKTHYDTPNPPANTNTRTRCPKSQGDRKLGIRNQRKELEESRTTSNMPQIDLQGLYSELGQLRQFKNFINNQLEKLGKIFGILYHQNQNDRNEQNRSSIFGTLNFFDQLKQQLHKQQQKSEKVSKLENQNSYLRGRIQQFQFTRKDNKQIQKQLPSEIQFERSDANQNLLQYVRKQMKNQYSKQYDALKLGEEKFNLLKKKIYEEYRSRIIGVLGNKNKDQRLVGRLQGILERFIEGLSNLSHKEAVLAKQIKLKQSARKQAEALRNKVKYLTQIIEMKKGYCSRQPLNVFMCENENQWHDVIKLQARILSQEAELSKLQEQLDLSKTNSNYIEQQLKLNLTELKEKEDEVLKLKKEIIKMQRQNEKELTKRQQQLDSLQKRYFDQNTGKKNSSGLKESEFQAMKEDLQRKKQIIKNLKDKEKMLQQLLESTQRNESQFREKSKRDIFEEQRKDNALRELKEANRELRTENRNMKEEINGLMEELQNKNNLLKRIKNDGDQHRIRTLKTDQQNVQKLKQQIGSLKDEINKLKQSYDKLKKKRQKQVQQYQSQIKKIKNQAQIQQRSYQSIIRALIDTMRRIYTAIDIHMRKKGKKIDQAPDFDELLNNPSKIDSLKVYESFERAIQTMKI